MDQTAIYTTHGITHNYFSNISSIPSSETLTTSSLDAISLYNLNTGSLENKIAISLEDTFLFEKITMIKSSDIFTMVGSASGRLIYVNITDGSKKYLNFHLSEITDCIITKNKIIVSSLDKKISIWDKFTQELISKIKFEEPVFKLFYRNEKILVNLRSGEILEYCLKSENLINNYSEVKDHPGKKGGIYYSDYILIFCSEFIYFYFENKVIYKIVNKEITPSKIDIDDKKIYIQSGDRIIYICSIKNTQRDEGESFEFSQFFKIENKLTLSEKIVSFKKVNDKFVVATNQNRIYVYYYSDLKLNYTIGEEYHKKAIKDLDFKKDYIVSIEDNSSIVWDKNGKIIQKLDFEQKINSCLLYIKKSPLLILSFNSGPIKIFNFESDEEISSFEPKEEIKYLYSFKANKKRFIAGFSTYKLYLFKISKNKQIDPITSRKFEKQITAIRYLKESSSMAVATLGLQTELYELSFTPGSLSLSKKPSFRLYGHSLPITAILANKEENLIFTASLDKTIRVFEPAHGELKKVLTGHKEGITALSLVGERGEYLASAGRDKKIIFWDLKKLALLKELKRCHGGEVWAMRARGETLVTGCEDRGLRVFNAGLLDFIEVFSPGENEYFSEAVRGENEMRQKIGASIKWKAVYLINFVKAFVEAEVEEGRLDGYIRGSGLKNKWEVFCAEIAGWEVHELDEFIRCSGLGVLKCLLGIIKEVFRVDKKMIGFNICFVVSKVVKENYLFHGEENKRFVSSILEIVAGEIREVKKFRNIMKLVYE